jgi:putative peptidoglycan lipid II flippase
MDAASQQPAPSESTPTQGADLVGRHKKLGWRTALISVLTLVSRILGYVREILSAALFGDRSAIFDAFITAWRVTNLFRRFLGEGAISTSFQTAMTEVECKYGEEAGARLFRGTIRVLIMILLGVCMIVMGLVALMPDRMPITNWAWLGADPEPVRHLTLLVMPFVVLVCAGALIGGALQVRGHFATPALAPVALNIVWIATLATLAATFGWGVAPNDGVTHMRMAEQLAVGVLIAGAIQLLVQIPALYRFGLVRLQSPRAQIREMRHPAFPGAPGPGTVLKRALPLALGAAVYQINVMVDGLMAEGLLPDGGPTLHYYANRVQQFPLALVAIAATSAVFPALQAHGHKGDLAAVRRLHDTTHRSVAFLAIPASVGLFVLAAPIISVSFERGAFGSEGVVRASGALRMLALAVLPAGAMGLVARTYYSLGDFKTPVRVSVVLLVVNAILNLVLIRSAGMDVDGLALATAMTSWLGLTMLLPGLRHRLPAGEPGQWKSFARTGLCAALSGGVAWLVRGVAAERLGATLGLLLAMTAGGAVHLVAAVALRAPEMSALRRRRSR